VAFAKNLYHGLISTMTSFCPPEMKSWLRPRPECSNNRIEQRLSAAHSSGCAKGCKTSKKSKDSDRVSFEGDGMS